MPIFTGWDISGNDLAKDVQLRTMLAQMLAMTNMPCVERDVRQMLLLSALSRKLEMERAGLEHLRNRPHCAAAALAIDAPDAGASGSAPPSPQERCKRIEDVCAAIRREASSAFVLPPWDGVKAAPKSVRFSATAKPCPPVFDGTTGKHPFYDSVVAEDGTTYTESDSDDNTPGAGAAASLAARPSTARQAAETLLAATNAPSRWDNNRRDCLTNESLDRAGLCAPPTARPLLDIPQLVMWCQCNRLARDFRRAVKMHIKVFDAAALHFANAVAYPLHYDVDSLQPSQAAAEAERVISISSAAVTDAADACTEAVRGLQSELAEFLAQTAGKQLLNHMGAENLSESSHVYVFLYHMVNEGPVCPAVTSATAYANDEIKQMATIMATVTSHAAFHHWDAAKATVSQGAPPPPRIYTSYAVRALPRYLHDGHAFVTQHVLRDLLESERLVWPLPKFLAACLGPLRCGMYGPFSASTQQSYYNDLQLGRSKQSAGANATLTSGECRAEKLALYCLFAANAKVFVRFDWGDTRQLRRHLTDMMQRCLVPQDDWAEAPAYRFAELHQPTFTFGTFDTPAAAPAASAMYSNFSSAATAAPSPAKPATPIYNNPAANLARAQFRSATTPVKRRKLAAHSVADRCGKCGEVHKDDSVCLVISAERMARIVQDARCSTRVRLGTVIVALPGSKRWFHTVLLDSGSDTDLLHPSFCTPAPSLPEALIGPQLAKGLFQEAGEMGAGAYMDLAASTGYTARVYGRMLPQSISEHIDYSIISFATGRKLGFDMERLAEDTFDEAKWPGSHYPDRPGHKRGPSAVQIKDSDSEILFNLRAPLVRLRPLTQRDLDAQRARDFFKKYIIRWQGTRGQFIEGAETVYIPSLDYRTSRPDLFNDAHT